MNTRKAAIAALFALSTLAGIGLLSSAAEAGPIVSPGHYCLSYAYGGTDRGFISYQQCEATASGQAAECYGNTPRDDEEDLPTFGLSAHRHEHR